MKRTEKTVRLASTASDASCRLTPTPLQHNKDGLVSAFDRVFPTLTDERCCSKETIASETLFLIHGVHQHYVSDSQQAPSVTRPDSLLAPASPILACSPMHRLLHLHSCNKTHVPCVHTFDTVTRQSWSIILHDITSKVQTTVFGGKSSLLVFVLCTLILLWSVSAILHNMNGSVSLPTESS